MEQGKTEEEIDAIMMEGEEEAEETADDSLAQEALDATEEESSPAEESVSEDKPPEKKMSKMNSDELDAALTEETSEEETAKEEVVEEKPEVDPKDAVIGGFRKKNRELELANAKLEGKMETLAEIQKTEVKPVELSPIEKKMKEQDVESVEELDLTPAEALILGKQETAWDQKQAETKTSTDTESQANVTSNRIEEALQEGELSEVKMGKGLDLNSVVHIGVQYLNDQDKKLIANITTTKGEAAALVELYKVSVKRTLAIGNDDSKVLQIAINARKKSQAKPKKEPIDIDKLTTEDEDVDIDKGEAETVGSHSRLLSFMGTDDFFDGERLA